MLILNQFVVNKSSTYLTRVPFGNLSFKQLQCVAVAKLLLFYGQINGQTNPSGNSFRLERITLLMKLDEDPLRVKRYLGIPRILLQHIYLQIDIKLTTNKESKFPIQDLLKICDMLPLI